MDCFRGILQKLAQEIRTVSMALKVAVESGFVSTDLIISVRHYLKNCCIALSKMSP